jgi:hypothetical protein
MALTASLLVKLGMGRSAILTLRHAAAPPKTAMDGMPSYF